MPKLTGIEVRKGIINSLKNGPMDDGSIHNAVWGNDSWEMFYVTLLEIQNLKLQGKIIGGQNDGYNVYFYQLPN